MRNTSASRCRASCAYWPGSAASRQYWLLDTRESADRPTMRVYRRRGQARQRVLMVGFGETYTTKLLPGFKLVLDPRR